MGDAWPELWRIPDADLPVAVPEGVAASFTCGGIPHVPANATEVYEHTFPRMARKTAQFYERYGVDADRVAAVADQLPTVAEIAEAGGIGGDSGSLPEGTRCCRTATR